MLTTLGRLQAELRNTTAVKSADAVAQLTATILEVSYDIARRCNRDFFYVSNFVEQVSGYATPYLTVKRHTPIDISKTVTVTSDVGSYDTSAYTITPQMARLGRIFSKLGGWSWSATFLSNIGQDPFTSYEDPYYRVTYSGGYVTPQQALDNPNDPTLGVRTLPYDLERACLDWCIARWTMRGQNPLLKSERLMSYSYQLDTAAVTTGATGVPSVDAAIARYQRIGVSS